jgi:surface antigen
MREIRAVLTALALVVTMLGLTAAPAQAAGDDYRWRTDTTQKLDPWGYTMRQCVSFVAWRMYQYKRPIPNASQHWGSAYHWDEAAKSLGKVVTTRPKVGAIAQWNANEPSRYYGANGAVGTIRAGGYGHVAYVMGVYGDGSVKVEQYNIGGNRAYSQMRVKAPRYIYVLP